MKYPHVLMVSHAYVSTATVRALTVMTIGAMRTMTDTMTTIRSPTNSLASISTDQIPMVIVYCPKPSLAYFTPLCSPQENGPSDAEMFVILDADMDGEVTVSEYSAMLNTTGVAIDYED